VVSAYDALRDLLALSADKKEGGDDEKPQSRLPKDLLQTCIRPVLLNLRDYTRLSVPLLRGLARLLSLLSSWFNKTLGEKLLEHLQKWADPEMILPKKIWKEGDEPTVAAAVIDLFSLLPNASQFVERLCRITVTLEASLHAYKLGKIDSPYRRPLARFLNKHCQDAVTFFLQRLRNPFYSDIFQSILKLDESRPLRAYLAEAQCSVTLLNVCFERPLAIIRSEKTASSEGKKQGTTPEEVVGLLAMHGISADSSAAKRQKESAARQDVESKQNNVRLLQSELSRWDDLLQARLAEKASSQSTDLQASVDEASEKVDHLKAAYAKAQEELSNTTQRYKTDTTADEAASPRDVAAKSDSPRPMTIDALELQYQGFKLIETLIKMDASYLTEHNDIIRAFRWLWRSKGRYLRLQHEESVPPRFHDESRLLASLLIRYAESNPKDVDILFELLRIFLQATSRNYLFVRRFLVQTVSHSITLEQKRLVMQRFFALMAGDGSEETKVLSIQLMVLPMLRSSMTRSADSVEEDADNALVDAGMVEKFVTTVLFKNGTVVSCGDRIRVELLKLSTFLIEYCQGLISEYRKDVIRYSWSFLKSDDTHCKNWAYVCVCRVIAAFDTPASIILQVYGALLTLHQQEGKEHVRIALDILIPVLPDRLGRDDFQKAIDFTNKVIFEEGNSAPQLAHVWHTIVAHASIFAPYRHNLARQMINSLNRLGLPPNCPSENRALAVSMAELVVHWNGPQNQNETRAEDHEAGGRKRRRNTSAETNRKRAKDSDGRPIDLEDSSTCSTFTMDDEMVSEDHSLGRSVVQFLPSVKWESLIYFLFRRWSQY
jgi:transformation/transcription domain-associated protein